MKKAMIVATAVVIVTAVASAATAQTVQVQLNGAGQADATYYQVMAKVPETKFVVAADWLTKGKQTAFGAGYALAIADGFTVIPHLQVNYTVDKDIPWGLTVNMKMFATNLPLELSMVAVTKWKVLPDVPDVFFTDTVVRRPLFQTDGIGVDLLCQVNGIMTDEGNVNLGIGPGIGTKVGGTNLTATAMYGVGNLNEHDFTALLTIFIPVPVLDLLK